MHVQSFICLWVLFASGSLADHKLNNIARWRHLGVDQSSVCYTYHSTIIAPQISDVAVVTQLPGGNLGDHGVMPINGSTPRPSGPVRTTTIDSSSPGSPSVAQKTPFAPSSMSSEAASWHTPPSQTLPSGSGTWPLGSVSPVSTSTAQQLLSSSQSTLPAPTSTSVASRVLSASVVAGQGFNIDISSLLRTPEDLIEISFSDPQVDWVNYISGQTPALFGTVPAGFNAWFVNVTLAIAREGHDAYSAVVSLEVFQTFIEFNASLSSPFEIDLKPYLENAQDETLYDVAPFVDWILFDEAAKTLSGTVPGDIPLGSTYNITIHEESTAEDGSVIDQRQSGPRTHRFLRRFLIIFRVVSRRPSTSSSEILPSSAQDIPTFATRSGSVMSTMSTPSLSPSLTTGAVTRSLGIPTFLPTSAMKSMEEFCEPDLPMSTLMSVF